MSNSSNRTSVFDSRTLEDISWSGGCGTDFMMYENPSFICERRQPYKLDATLAIFCTSGSAVGRVNLKEYRIEKGGLLVVLPNHIMERDYVSEDFKATYIIYSSAFQYSLQIPRAFHLSKEIEDNPRLNFTSRTLEAVEAYFAMCKSTIQADGNPNRLEILRLLTKAFFLGLGYYLHKQDPDEMLRGEDRITSQFISLVESDYAVLRRVEEYASRMAISPKYLSMSVKSSTGKTPSQLLGTRITLEAKALLASTDKTISQIADELGFVTQSEFGRYFKRYVGMSPKAYRKSVR
ncbi:MAG: helix-turn-helix domain-containing protein [Candidatus Cryptobacteroides sp.]